MLFLHPVDALALTDERARASRPSEVRRRVVAAEADRRIDGPDGSSIRSARTSVTRAQPRSSSGLTSVTSRVIDSSS
jgi:hypothetical protein